MSALKLVFPRVHFRYDECPYADDLEHFAAWLCGRAYRNKRARTHLYNVQQVLLDLAMPSGSKLDLAKVAVAFRRSGDARLRYQHSFTIFTQFLRSRGQLIEPPPKVDRFESIRREFCERLVDRRGLRPSSVGGYDHWIADFLRRRKAQQIVRRFCLFRARTEPTFFVPCPFSMTKPQPYVRPVIVTPAQVIRMLAAADVVRDQSGPPMKAAVHRIGCLA
jgi:hypothetical protein